MPMRAMLSIFPFMMAIWFQNSKEFKSIHRQQTSPIRIGWFDTNLVVLFLWKPIWALTTWIVEDFYWKASMMHLVMQIGA